MFLLEAPYVSEFLKQSVLESGAPVLDNAKARQALAGADAKLTSAEEFARLLRAGGRLYSNSENCIQWIEEHLQGTVLPGRIALLKDKARFRDLTRDLYPDFQYRELALDELSGFDPGSFPKPFVVKPSVGFFSLGVHKVHEDADWPAILRTIQEEVRTVRDMYPAQVLDLGRFVVEECIEGEEFAVDAYFNGQGEPVILNIFTHLFASRDDVSDRVYYTSANIVRTWEERFRELLAKVGHRAGLRDFPIHAELRVDTREGGACKWASQECAAFIEINPMRFAGWCCTDLAHFAYGLNPYQHYLEQTRPDWDAILAGREGKVWSLVVADIPPDVDRSRIASVDYEAFRAAFARPLELRPVDYVRYSVFAFLFAETPEADLSELTAILKADLRRYIRMK
ncbi:MAG: ATP-grasp domain-containing protein [Desulfovibrio sp.]